MKPEIAIIVAKAADNGIGCSSGLPWHIPEELKYFKKRTIGKPVIMGRKTFLSLGKPLKGRENIVLTKGTFHQGGITIKNNLKDAINHALKSAMSSNQDEIMIIGGENIFKQAFEFADIVYLTRINKENFKNTNAFLPEKYFKGWKVIETKERLLHDKKSNSELECHFEILRKAS